ncbi:uncharacterized protein V1510DRAFT_363290, partial [Dipodascopsis tothii]|uniref:uncharacterized protein n=1 Tax=Dipodascopsis tothii TaxID=44089 RepID=UPI0034CFF8D1
MSRGHARHHSDVHPRSAYASGVPSRRDSRTNSISSLVFPGTGYGPPPFDPVHGDRDDERPAAGRPLSVHGLASVSAAPPAVPTKRKAGRPRDSVADAIAHEVRKPDETVTYKCNFCDATWAHYNPFRVKKHGIDCKGAPSDLKVRLSHELSLKAAASMGSATSKRHKYAYAYSSPYPYAPPPAPRRGTRNQRPLESALLELLIATPLPLAVVYSRSFRALLREAAPGFAMPSRHALVNELLPAEVETIRTRIRWAMHSEYSLTLSFDVFETQLEQILFVVYVTTGDGRTYCVSAQEYAEQPPSVDFLSRALLSDIQQIGPEKLSAIATPSDNLSRALRQLICARHKNVVVVEALSTHFSELAARLAAIPLLDSAVEIVRLVQTYFRQSGTADTLLRMRLAEQNIAEGLRPVVPGDPLSVYAAAAALKRCLPALVTVITIDWQKLDKLSSRVAICDLLTPDTWLYCEFTRKLDLLLALLRPVHNSVRALDGSAANLADVLVHWASLALHYRNLFAERSFYAVKPELLADVIRCVNECYAAEMAGPNAPGIMLAAMLHPRLAQAGVIATGSPGVRDLLVQGLDCELEARDDCDQQTLQTLFGELVRFRRRDGIFRGVVCDDAGGPQGFWQDAWRASNNTDVLPAVALRLFDRSPTNMAADRVSRTLDWIDLNIQNRIPTSMLLSMLQCRHYYAAEHA